MTESRLSKNLEALQAAAGHSVEPSLDDRIESAIKATERALEKRAHQVRPADTPLLAEMRMIRFAVFMGKHLSITPSLFQSTLPVRIDEGETVRGLSYIEPFDTENTLLQSWVKLGTSATLASASPAPAADRSGVRISAPKR